MSLLRNTLIGILVLSLFTFIALFGQLPALRKTPIGWLQRALCLHLPNGLKNVDRRVTGGKITSRSKRLGRYLFYEGNPVVLILFLVLLTGSSILFLWNAYYRLPTRLLLPIPVLLTLPYAFTYLCVIHKAHFINSSNHEDRLRDYPYDHILFRPAIVCSTCNLVKPARSKHCSLCGHCVAKCDHHCPWVNNCLGRGNYRYFLSLLLALGMVEVYGASLCWYIVSPYLRVNPSESLSPQGYWTRLGNALVTAINAGGLSISGVGLLAASTAGLPLALLGYHIYLIWAGMTTNESQKWADWRDDMADGFVFKASREALKKHNRLRKHSEAEANGKRANPALDAYGDEIEVAMARPELSDVVLVQTNNGQPPTGQDALWTRVWSLKEIDNIYDLGGLANFVEVYKGH